MQVVILSASFAVCAFAHTPWIHTGTKGDPNFYDEFGRIRIFHGSNRVQKNIPWYFPEMYESDKEFELMKKMGFTMMRLGFMWSGYNPDQGFFNQTYIDVVRTVVRKMADHGIYALLDMHQDGLSSKFCLYDGMPLWVANKSVPRKPFPWPFTGDCSTRSWSDNILSEAAAQTYQDLYDNHLGMLDDLADFWRHAAEQFTDEPGVLGYEIMNEPFAGDFYRNPLIGLPAIAGANNLMRMHEASAAAIREHDDRHIVFYSPVNWGMFFHGRIQGSGFHHVPGGDDYQNRSAFSYHWYCDSINPGYGKRPVWTRLLCDSVAAPSIFHSVKKHLQETGGAAVMTEGLACADRDTAECHRVLSQLDDHLYSWTDYGDSQGTMWNPSAMEQETWARTYARAVAGRPKSMSFDPGTKVFDFCFTMDMTISAPTEIFASSTYSYSAGMVVEATENLHVNTSVRDLVLLTPSANAQSGAKACINIRRAGNDILLPTVI